MSDELDPLALNEIFAEPEALIDAGWDCLRVDDASPPYWSYQFDGFELTIEPLTFGRVAIALYRGRVLEWPAKIEIPARA